MTEHEKFQETMMWYWERIQKEKNGYRRKLLMKLRADLFDRYWGFGKYESRKMEKTF